MPNEVLQESIYGENTDVSDEIAKIRNVANWIEDWGGTFEAVSGVGVGMHFTIRLSRFL